MKGPSLRMKKKWEYPRPLPPWGYTSLVDCRREEKVDGFGNWILAVYVYMYVGGWWRMEGLVYVSLVNI